MGQAPYPITWEAGRQNAPGFARVSANSGDKGQGLFLVMGRVPYPLTWEVERQNALGFARVSANSGAKGKGGA